MAKGTNGNGKRVAVVAGLRTPFAKQSSAWKQQQLFTGRDAATWPLIGITGTTRLRSSYADSIQARRGTI